MLHMRDWKMTTIAECSTILGDGLHGTPKYDENGEYAFINGNNLHNGRIVIKTDTKRVGLSEYEKHKKELTDRTVLVSINGTLGNVAVYNGEKVILGKSACYFNVSSDCDVQFMRYVASSPCFQQYINSVATGTTIKNVSLKQMREYSFLIPELEEQQRIAKVLHLLDQKIENNQKINDNLQQQAATIFRQWFATNSESEKWPMVTLDDLTSLVSRGIAPKYDDDSAQIVLNQKCIRDHYIDISLGRRHKSKATNEKWLQYGDLLINSTGEGTLGRAAQVWFVPENMTVDSHVTVVRPKNQLLLFYIGLWGISHEREIEALHTGSTGQTELPRERVKAMELRQPDNDTLARFNSIIKPIVSIIIANQQENTRLASIRDTLLPKLMSGEIDVTGIQI